MEWPAETELAQMNVVAAPYGGPMAIVRQTTKVGVSPKPIIRIFTASGHLISTIQVTIERKIHCFTLGLIQIFKLLVE